VEDLLKQITICLLPIDQLGKARQVVTTIAETMLREYGYSTSLDTIRSLSKALSDYGANKRTSARATTQALEGYLEELDAWLSGISSVEELNTFENDLKAAMMDFGVIKKYIAYDIEHRREQLYERKSVDTQSSTRWKPVPIPDMSDADIQSLFHSLRED
jgi:hypothetical protein